MEIELEAYIDHLAFYEVDLSDVHFYLIVRA